MPRTERPPGSVGGRPRPPAVFFALRAPSPVAATLHRLAGAVLPPGTRVVPAANLHLTLLYLGRLPVGQVRRLCGAVDALEGLRCTLVLDHLGTFGGAGVLWSAPSVVPTELLRLVAGLREMALDAGVALQARSFQAHVTLARHVVRAPQRAAHPPIRWAVDGFSLLCSCRDGAGRVLYRCLRHWPPAVGQAGAGVVPGRSPASGAPEEVTGESGPA